MGSPEKGGKLDKIKPYTEHFGIRDKRPRLNGPGMKGPEMPGHLGMTEVSPPVGHGKRDPTLL